MTNVRGLHRDTAGMSGGVPVVSGTGKRVALVLGSGRIVVAPDSDVDEVSLEIWRKVEEHVREAWRQQYGE